ncbi:MAG: hypothetical protein NTX28_06210 [Novosphingobium sp.]|nr:hypothetical protein [Novosphingobium sp.]
MPITSTIRITGSVGANGRNNPADVKAVQQRLNDLSRPPLAKLVVDGLAGPKTNGMIADFQKKVVGLRAPDSRVDPNGRTLAALNTAASENLWIGGATPPAVTPPGVPPGTNPGAGPVRGLSSIEQGRLDTLRAQLKAQPDSGPARDFLEYVANNEVQTLKMILNAQGAAQYAVEAMMGINAALKVGFSARDIVTILTSRAIRLDAALDMMRSWRAVAPAGTRIVNALKSLGNIALVVQVLATLAVVIDHFRAGRFGPGFAEIYATGMGAAVPWGGFLNAIQEMLYAANPAAASDPRFGTAFRYLLAIDPIGAGKTAIDTGVTFTELLAKYIFGGQIKGNEVNDLIDRMRNSPMKFWVEIGESSGEWMGSKFGDWWYRNVLS